VEFFFAADVGDMWRKKINVRRFFLLQGALLGNWRKIGDWSGGLFCGVLQLFSTLIVRARYRVSYSD